MPSVAARIWPLREATSAESGSAPQGTTRQTFAESLPTSRIAFCGLGARGRLALICGIAQDLADLWQGKPVNQNPRIHDYFETQAREEGLGNAFQKDSKAALNTGLPGAIPIDMAGLTIKQQQTLNRITNTAERYAELLMADPRQTLETLEAENVSTALLFAKASRTGILDTSIACGPRNVVGKALELMTKEALKLAKIHLSLKIDFYFGAQIIDVDLKNSQKPVLTIQHQEDGRKEVLPAYDLLVKMTGTTWEVPVKSNVAKFAFTGIPNPDDIWSYLESRKLMLHDGAIKPGTKILIGGASLSSFDPVGILLTKTGIVKLDFSHPDGFVIDEGRARQYPSLITFFNRTHGEVVKSRHSHTASIPEEAAIFTPNMILSQQLQMGQDAYQVYLDMARLLTAMYLKKFPHDIEPRLKTPELLMQMAEENDKLAADPKSPTESGMMRSVFISFFFTFALGSNPVKKRQGLKQQYPLLVRHGWDATRSKTFNGTHTCEGSPEESAKHLAARRTLMNHIAAAPFPVHHLITRLYQLGVVEWVHGAYEHVFWSADEGLFNLNGIKAHALFAARFLTPDADALSKKILAQARQPEAGERVYDKGRFPLSPSGAYLHLIELGMPGQGRWRDGCYVNSQWTDTNNYDSAHQLMPIIATTIRMLENMIACKVSSPVERLMGLYRQSLPSPPEFSKQAEKLQKSYEECHEILLFGKLLATVYSTSEAFSNKMKRAQYRNTRNTMLQEIRRLGGEFADACDAYELACGKITYQPYDLFGFEATSPDFSAVQIKEMKRAEAEELERGDVAARIQLEDTYFTANTPSTEVSSKFSKISI